MIFANIYSAQPTLDCSAHSMPRTTVASAYVQKSAATVYTKIPIEMTRRWPSRLDHSKSRMAQMQILLLKCMP